MPVLFPRNPTSGLTRTFVLLLGILIPQFILFYPSLLGDKILLPLQILSWKSMYTPADPGRPPLPDRNPTAMDMVVISEPSRQFYMRELRQGRLPIWNPYIYAGTPCAAPALSNALNPYRLPQFLSDSPRAIAWSQLLMALIAGVGAYLFFRLALRLRFLSALLGAWGFPLCSALTFWGGYSVSEVFSFTPWLLLAVSTTVARPRSLAPAGLALVTALIIYAGHPQVAAHALIVSGFWGLWLIVSSNPGATSGRLRRMCLPAVSLLSAWIIGLLLAMPLILPTLDYLGESSRMTHRLADVASDRAPIGWPALTQLLLPHSQGDDLHSQSLLIKSNLAESAATGSVGLLIAVLLLPLAFRHTRLRSTAVFWLVLGFVAASQCLDIPLLAALLDHRPLSALSNNRFILFTGWSILVLGAIGLDTLQRRRLQFKLPDLVVPASLLLLAAWLLYRAFNAPVLAHPSPQTLVWFKSMDLASAAWAIVILIIWLVLFAPGATSGLLSRMCLSSPDSRRLVTSALILLSIGELLFNAYDYQTQSDASLYYPPIAPLQQIVKQVQQASVSDPSAPPIPSNRILGYGCFPPDLNLMFNLSDVRGYDTVDPDNIVELLLAARDPASNPGPSFARTLTLALPPGKGVARMLAIRYYIFRTNEPQPPTNTDYVVQIDPTAPSRVYVPTQILTEPDPQRRLQILCSPNFDPLQLALIETEFTTDGIPGSSHPEIRPTTLPFNPHAPHAIQGMASILMDSNEEVLVEAHMKTPGLLVLADRYAPGWNVTYRYAPAPGQSNKSPIDYDAPILRTNHALRGVQLPQGNWLVSFSYEPQSWIHGQQCAFAGLLGLIGLLVLFLITRIPRPTAPTLKNAANSPSSKTQSKEKSQKSL